MGMDYFFQVACPLLDFPAAPLPLPHAPIQVMPLPLYPCSPVLQTTPISPPSSPEYFDALAHAGAAVYAPPMQYSAPILPAMTPVSPANDTPDSESSEQGVGCASSPLPLTLSGPSAPSHVARRTTSFRPVEYFDRKDLPPSESLDSYIEGLRIARLGSEHHIQNAVVAGSYTQENDLWSHFEAQLARAIFFTPDCPRPQVRLLPLCSHSTVY